MQKLAINAYQKLLLNMGTTFKIFLSLILLPSVLFAHKVTLEDKSLEEIINNRMAKMQEIKSSSSKIYKIVSSGNFEEIKKLNDVLLHAAMEFKDLFPEGSQGGGASDLIWSTVDDPDNPDKLDTFAEYNQKFINDIEMIEASIELEDLEMLNNSFKSMAANCGSCHKKFKK